MEGRFAKYSPQTKKRAGSDNGGFLPFAEDSDFVAISKEI
jgi:hypothetical protein